MYLIHLHLYETRNQQKKPRKFTIMWELNNIFLNNHGSEKKSKRNKQKNIQKK